MPTQTMNLLGPSVSLFDAYFFHFQYETRRGYLHPYSLDAQYLSETLAYGIAILVMVSPLKLV